MDDQSFRSMIEAARRLRSEHGENTEYDRALVELVSDSAGLAQHRDFVERMVLGDGPINTNPHEYHAVNGVYLTLGEVRDFLGRFPDETPVTGALGQGFSNGPDYVNLEGISIQGEEEGSPSIIFEVVDTFDSRQW